MTKQEISLEEKIRTICTYHSDGGTSGYNLSEEQFQKLFDLFALQQKQFLAALRKKVKNLKRKELEDIAVMGRFVKMHNAAIDDVLSLLQDKESDTENNFGIKDKKGCEMHPRSFHKDLPESIACSHYLIDREDHCLEALKGGKHHEHCKKGKERG